MTVTSAVSGAEGFFIFRRYFYVSFHNSQQHFSLSPCTQTFFLYFRLFLFSIDDETMRKILKYSKNTRQRVSFLRDYLLYVSIEQFNRKSFETFICVNIKYCILLKLFRKSWKWHFFFGRFLIDCFITNLKFIFGIFQMREILEHILIFSIEWNNEKISWKLKNVKIPKESYFQLTTHFPSVHPMLPTFLISRIRRSFFSQKRHN